MCQEENSDRAASKLFDAEAQQQQRREIGDDTRYHDYHQTQQAERHRPLRPLRHQVHHAQQRRRHHDDGNHQAQQEQEPAGLRGENFLFPELPVEQPGVKAGRQANRQ